jgi:hypothetical protein
LAVSAQQVYAQGVKGANSHLFGGFANELLGPLAHFGGGLVGEGNGSYVRRRHTGLNQSCNFVSDYSRLARASARQHQAGAMKAIDRILLGQI